MVTFCREFGVGPGTTYRSVSTYVECLRSDVGNWLNCNRKNRKSMILSKMINSLNKTNDFIKDKNSLSKTDDYYKK